MKSSDLDQLLGSGGGKPLDFRAVYHALRDRLWLIILALLVCGTAAAVYVARAPLIYAAKTVMMAEEEEAKVVKIDQLNQENLRSSDTLNTLIQSIRSRAVLTRVVEQLKLHADPEFLTGSGATSTTPDDAMGRLGRAVKVELRKGTRLIDITVEHRVPQVAARIADAVAKEFLRLRFEQRSASTGLASEFLVTESGRLKEKLQKSEEALHRYRVEKNAVSLEENQNTVVEQLKSLNNQLSQARSERMRLEGDVARVKELAGKPAELIRLPSVAAHPTVVALKSSIAGTESQIAVLSQRYKPKHPKYIALQTQLENLREQLDKVVINAGELLSSSFRTAQETETEFTRALQEQEKRALDLNQKAIEYNVLAREMESNKAMYESVLTRMKEIGVTKELEQTPLRIAEPAFAYGPVRPDKTKILAGGIVGGLLLGIGLAFGLSMLDTSIKTVDEAEELLGLPVLAAVPKWKGESKGENPTANLPVISDPKGPIAESFRSLRSSLSLLGREETRRTFLFTSALPSEGKSFSASNYAITCAQLGISTLLIDADLRRPALSKLFFGEARKPGLADCLAGQSQLENAIIDSPVEKLRILPAGSTAPNPAELLASGEFAQVIQQALLSYDRVIIDTAPINAVSDTLILAPHVQSVCMVVRAGATARAAVQRAVKMLTDIKCKPVGTILNRLPHGHGAGYYYYYYAGEYGSEGVYGSKTG